MDWVTQINNNKMLIGLAMIFMNIGSRYILMDFTKEHEYIMMSQIFKQIVVFFIFFMATRDFILSIILTCLFTILLKFFLNKNSIFSLLPSKVLLAVQKQQSVVVPTATDYERAKAIVNTYEETQI